LLAHVESDDFRVHLPDEDVDIAKRATEAMKQLGLDETLASPELSAALAGVLGAVDMTATVRQTAWWKPIDTDELREELAVGGLDDPCLAAIVQRIDADEAVPPSTVISAYCALEGHLRGLLGLDMQL